MMFNRRYYGKGREDGGPTFEEEDHTQALLTILRHVHAFSISDFIPFLKPLDLDGHGKILKNALNSIERYDDPIIEERVQQWKDGKKKKKVEEDDILDILLSLKDENGKSLLSIHEIKAQIIELQIATIDNPSNAVEWAMAELLNQQKFLHKAIEELDKVVGRKRLVQESDIPKLKYITACVRESFRLHPYSSFNVPHVSNSDIVVAGYFIPKGSQVLLSRLGLGRNPRIWEDPLRFDPERHLKDGTVELGISEPNLRFITFTRGRRGCIGTSLGTNITIMLFARLLQGFSWSLLPGITKIDLSETHELCLSKPLHLYAKPRLSHNMYQRLIDHQP
ncbi:unnamed protein product [Citrullus colocynthis]|uniref:Cytochrome P450 n=1 Tax=Citrullus colocynthis TaxID=252529 RepID=A0ABP0Z639_9ROSI